MKKKRSTQSTLNANDFIIGIICLIGMSFALVYFWRDLNISFINASKSPIATIYFKKNTAQRKLLNGNIWERLKTATPIYDGDRIRTAGLSEAYTVFNDGTRIDLYENSLIQVYDLKKKRSVDFVNGSMHVKAGKKDQKKDDVLVVKTGTKVITFSENTAAVVAKDSSSENTETVTVTSGAVLMEETIPDVISPNGSKPNTKTTIIQAGDTFRAEALPVEINKFAVLMPPPHYSVTKTENGDCTLPFFWENSEQIVLEFAEDADFSKIVQVQNLVSSNCKAAVYLDFDGIESVFWRAYIPAADTTADTTADPAGATDTSPQNLEYVTGIVEIHENPKAVLQEVASEVFGEEISEDVVTQVEVSEQVNTSQLVEIINKVPEIQETVIPEPEEAVVEETLIEEAVEDGLEEPVAEVISGDAAKEISAQNTEAIVEAPVKEIAKEPVKEVQAVKEKPKVEVAAAKPAPAAKAEKKPEPKVETKAEKKPELKVEAKPAEKPAPKTEAAKPVEKAEPKPEPKPEPAPVVVEDPAITKVSPVLTVPANGKVFTDDDFAVDVPAISFKWNAVASAEAYELKIMQGSSVVVRKNLSNTEFVLKDDELAAVGDNGTYNWSVTASLTKDGKKWESKTAESSFQIQLGDLENVSVDTENLIQ